MANDKSFKIKNGLQAGRYLQTGGTETAGSVGYSLAGAEYDGKSFSPATQDTSPADFALKSDGSKLFVLGQANETLYQYSLSTTWDISTASYDSVSFLLTSQTTSVLSMHFKPDGTQVYLASTAPNDEVLQYSLSTAWDLSTISYDSKSFSTASQSTSPFGLYFKTDGTKMYVLSSVPNDTLFQYSLSTAWDVSTASYDSVSLDVSSVAPAPYGLDFNLDGTRLYVIDIGTGDAIYQYSLSAAWDISTASYDSISFAFSLQDTNPRSAMFGDNGTKLYMSGLQNDSIYQYSTVDYTQTLDLSTGSYFSFTPSDATTVSFSNPPASGTAVGFVLDITGAVGDTYDFSSADTEVGTFDLSGNARDTGGIYVKPDGTKFYIAAFRNAANGADSRVHEYNMTTAWDITTAVYVNSFSVHAQETYLSGVTFSPSGTKMLIVGFGADAVHEYTLSTAWDITTASFDRSLSTTSYEGQPRGLQVNNDGSKLYVVGTDTRRIVEYTLPNAYSLQGANYSTDVDGGSSEAIMFSSNGTKVFLADDDTSLREYALSIAFDISSVVGASPDNTYTLTTNTAGMHDGGKGENLYLANVGGDSVTQVKIYADATITWPSTMKWPDGTAPVAPTSGDRNIYAFVTADGGTTYCGKQAAEGVA